jgi:hypothetical protein
MVSTEQSTRPFGAPVTIATLAVSVLIEHFRAIEHRGFIAKAGFIAHKPPGEIVHLDYTRLGSRKPQKRQSPE